jgi:hypothetical protein
MSILPRVIGSAAIALILSFAGITASAATPTYAGFPAPGGTTASGTGSVSNIGGRTWNYSSFDATAYSDLYYLVGSTVNAIFNPNAPALSANSTTDYLSFNAGLSNMAGGVAIWTGSTNVPLAIGGATTLFTEFQLKVSDTSNNPLALTDASSYGLPGTGAALKVSSDFSANWQFLASTDGITYSAALPLYNNLPYKVAGASLLSNVGGAFYSTAPVPEPESYAMLLAGLGLISAALKSRKSKQA